MPGSTLTVRTLALATVALVLACGHAVKAMGAQRAAADQAVAHVAPSVSPIRVAPAGSGHSTVATFSNGGSSGGSSSKVSTFTSSTGSAGNSIVTFAGDRVDRLASAANARRLQPSPRAKTKGGILPPKGDPPIIAVRRVVKTPAPTDPSALPPLIGPPAPEANTVTVVPKPTSQPQLRNAFAGIAPSRSSTDFSAAAPLVYAHASAK